RRSVHRARQFFGRLSRSGISGAGQAQRRAPGDHQSRADRAGRVGRPGHQCRDWLDHGPGGRRELTGARRPASPAVAAVLPAAALWVGASGGSVMREETLDIVSKDGAIETFICRPEHGAHPVVCVLMDAPGIREELRDMVRRLATVGYYVRLPRLYHPAGGDPISGPGVPEHGSADHQRMRAVRTKMTIPPVMDDIAALLAFADAQDGTKSGPVGIHGYCMSG